MRNIVLIISVLLSCNGLLYAQVPKMLKDLNLVGNGVPSKFCTVNNILYYTFDDGIHGKEIWRSDGTPSGTYMLKDIYEGPIGSVVPKRYTADLTELIEFKGKLYFTVFSKNYGVELWVSDGTEASTNILKDINPGEGSSINSITGPLLTDCQQYLFFKANNGITGEELYKTDGTTAGTSIVADLTPGNGDTPIKEIEYSPSIFTNEVFFSTITKIYRLNYNNSNPNPPISVPTIFYQGNNIENLHIDNYLFLQKSLYFSSNGNIIRYNYANSTFTILTSSNSTYPDFVSLNGFVIFNGYDNVNKYEPWITDGTVAGTKILKNINTVSDNLSFSPLIAINNNLYFSTKDNGIENTLWKTDGTTIGTVKVVDPINGTTITNPLLGETDGSFLYVISMGGVNPYVDYKLQSVNLTSANISTLNNFAPAYSKYSDEIDMKYMNQNIFISGNAVLTGFELWKTPGQNQAATLLKDFSFGNTDPLTFKTIGSQTFFSTRNGVNFNHRIWRTDGTETGTFPIGSVYPELYHFNLDSFGTSPFDSEWESIGDDLIFSGSLDYKIDNELWKSDGTVNGTINIKDINPLNKSSSPSSLTKFNDTTIVFTANNELIGRELWKTNGTSLGTVLIKDILVATGGSNPSNLIYCNGYIFFVAYTLGFGKELWKTNGTNAGTELVNDINPGSANTNFGEFVVLNNKLYFTANTPIHGGELWVSDGTEQGTAMLKDINIGSGDSNPRNLKALGNYIYFSANNGTQGLELWKSNGTETVLVKNISEEDIVPQDSNPKDFVSVGGVVYFTANKKDEDIVPFSENTGRELWRTNGTATGTYMVKDINNTNNLLEFSDGIYENLSFYDNQIKVLGNTMFFLATDNNNKTNLWRSDGTNSGTFMVNDFQIEPNISLDKTKGLYADTLNKKLYFVGLDAVHGHELWVLDYCPTSQNISTVVNSNIQKQQASQTLISNSSISATGLTYGNLNIQYTAGKSITLQPGFSVEGIKLPQNRKSVFKAEIGGCN
jgi:ELWxxDGT repeat protein